MWIAAILSALISAIGIGVNASMNRKTNEANTAAVEKSNQANAEQSELAYQRSKPINQLNNLMAAGMSKGAALQTLSGGGSYTAPVMQSSSFQTPNLDFASLAERIGGIPSNAQQSAMVKQQLESMKLDNEIKREQLELAKAAAAREASSQGLNLERDSYDFETRKQTDALRAIISHRAAEMNVDMSSIHSEQEMIDKLKLNDVAEWREARAETRENLFNYIESSNRLRTSNQNAKDIHDKMYAELQDFKAAQNAREREYHLRAMAAQFEQLMQARGLVQEFYSLRDDFEFDSKGNLVLENGFPKIKNPQAVEAFGAIRGFWRDVSDVLPLNIIGDIIRVILKR